MSLLSRRFWVIGVSGALPHDLMEDAPNGIEVGLFRFSNRYHSYPPEHCLQVFKRLGILRSCPHKDIEYVIWLARECENSGQDKRRAWVRRHPCLHAAP